MHAGISIKIDNQLVSETNQITAHQKLTVHFPLRVCPEAGLFPVRGALDESACQAADVVLALIHLED